MTFCVPAAVGWAAITNISLPTKDQLVFTVERDYDRGPVESAFVQQLDELRPHLARSALMSARLQLERARVASETLALIGLPALVFDESGQGSRREPFDRGANRSYSLARARSRFAERHQPPTRCSARRSTRSTSTERRAGALFRRARRRH